MPKPVRMERPFRTNGSSEWNAILSVHTIVKTPNRMVAIWLDFDKIMNSERFRWIWTAVVTCKSVLWNEASGFGWIWMKLLCLAGYLQIKLCGFGLDWLDLGQMWQNWLDLVGLERIGTALIPCFEMIWKGLECLEIAWNGFEFVEITWKELQIAWHGLIRSEMA